MKDQFRLPHLGRAPQQSGSEITLRKLEVFWAVALSETLTRAAKLLGVTQPSLSQQLAGLEAIVGDKLFERRSNNLVLTDVGRTVLGRTEAVLRSMQELEDSLPRSADSAVRTIRVAGVASVMRTILPDALSVLCATRERLEIDMHEAPPDEILELLYARKANLGLLAANSVAEAAAGFQQHVLVVDPYVLVTPAELDLKDVADPPRDLSEHACSILNRSIHFVFGNQHARRIQEWYDRALPGNRQIGRARSFELVIEMVRSGLGVCVAPALSVLTGPRQIAGLRLYAIDIEPRRIVAMLPTHCQRMDPYPDLVAALREVGGRLRLPQVAPVPPFVALAARTHAVGPRPDKTALWQG